MLPTLTQIAKVNCAKLPLENHTWVFCKVKYWAFCISSPTAHEQPRGEPKTMSQIYIMR